MRRSLSILSAIVFLVSMPIAADWDISGQTTTRASDYTSHGDDSASPYAKTGDLYFNEFSIYFKNNDSDYSVWRAELSGLLNKNNDYRSSESGFIAERFNVTREDGEGHVPYRLEIGDYFSYYSHMTLQQSLKGAQLELQPFLTNNRQHSFIISSGSNQTQWRDFDLDDDYFNAFSWLVNDSRFGRWGLNFVHNSRESDSANTLDTSHRVLSLAADVPVTIGSQRIRLEGEIASFDGDHEGRTTPASGQDQKDTAISIAISGRDRELPLEYRIRYEDFGEDYRPGGATTISDRELTSFQGGWLFDNGLRLQARAHRIEEEHESTNPFTIRNIGLNLSGVRLDKLHEGLSGRVDAYAQNNDDELGTVDYSVKTVTINFNAPITETVYARLDAFIQDLESDLNDDQDVQSSQLSLAFDFPASIKSLDGRMSLGLSANRDDTDLEDNNEMSLTMSLQLANNDHSIRFNYGGFKQDRHGGLGTTLDVKRNQFGFDYRYDRGRHSMGIEANAFKRNPERGRDTEAWLVAAHWTYYFDERNQQATPYVNRSTYSPSRAGDVANLSDLAPGTGADDVDTWLTNSNVTAGRTIAGWHVYEARLLPDTFQRQRLLLDYELGVLRRSALIIDFDDVGDQRSMQQIYDDVLRQLMSVMGRPDRTHSIGEFSDQLIADMIQGRFARVSEWVMPEGIARFGIVRRLNGEIRMEVQYSQELRPITDTLWAIDDIN
ncbi:MAG: hypothetical protein JJ934_08350 [Pseudomonadales bacterium]|nr:hypothetical protein [Pseudomonadales bacterium]